MLPARHDDDDDDDIYIRGEFNKFPDFFAQAFKIVVYS